MQEHGAVTLACLLILQLVLLVLDLHLVLEDGVEFFFHLSNSYFVEAFFCAFTGVFVNLAQLVFKHGRVLDKFVVEVVFKFVDAVFNCFLALVLADIAPGALDRGDRACINGIAIAVSQVKEHLTGQLPAIERLRLNPI